ncbi:MAG TPA: 50S ribosomal protein L3 N(5)-glutamine methyltransferase [Burkholderiaceae bacterium]|nr:50S ribosomal protein L3 N(5)-glutamine methyltransferase [Burkholderiaceae bacterium]
MSIDAQANLRTLRDVLRYAVTRFNESGIYFGHGQIDAYDEATFLVMRSLHLPIERLDVFLSAYLTHAEINSLLQVIDLRVKKRLPAAYLLKEAWLQGYRFYVDNRAIIPRSFIAELLKDALDPWVADPGEVREVLDLCTGSGCLAVIAADVFPNAKVDAVDVSKDALAVARRNVEDYHFNERVRLLESDLFSNLAQHRYDVILCNPPYVTDASMAKLPKEYQHEPKLALAGGADGMNVIRRLLKEARSYLKRGGVMIVEVGGERATVEKQFKDVPMTWLTTSAGDDMVFLVRQEDLSS